MPRFRNRRGRQRGDGRGLLGRHAVHTAQCHSSTHNRTRNQVDSMGNRQAPSQDWIDNLDARDLKRWKMYAAKCKQHQQKQLFDGVCFSCATLLWTPHHLHYLRKTDAQLLGSPPLRRKYKNLPTWLTCDTNIEHIGPCWMACRDCAHRWDRCVNVICSIVDSFPSLHI